VAESERRAVHHRLEKRKTVQLLAQDLDGIWLPDNKEIIVRRSLRGRRLLESIIHETIHTEIKLRHRKINRVSKAISRLLWKAMGKRGWAKRLGVKRVGK
jgi:hypothetical protein